MKTYKINILVTCTLFLIIFTSCKKEKENIVPVKNVTIKVDSQYMDYNLNVNVDLTLDAATPNALSYKWEPWGDTISVVKYIRGTINYKVEIKTQDTIYNYSIFVFEDKETMFFPNSFSPDYNGKNEFWIPMGDGFRLDSFYLKIINPDGNIMFEINKYEGRGWDGKVNGILQPNGYYNYFCKWITNSGANKSKSGILELVR